MDEPVSFEIESDAEQVATHQLNLLDIRVDEQFIADLRKLDIIDYTAQFSTGNASYVELYMLRPCYAVELTPLIAPLVEQLVARQNTANAG